MEAISEFLAGLLGDGTGLGAGQFLIALGVVYAGGFLSSLTPCIYPMIPITVSVIGGMNPTHKGVARKSWREVALRCFVYISGMSIVYAFLGVLAGLTGRVFGTLTNNSGWYLVMGIVMSLGALVMLDVVPFDPVAWWENLKRRWNHARGRPHVSQSPTERRELTWLGAFTLGMSSGFIAAPCTTPALTAVLAFIAQTQSVVVGMVLMLAFAWGLGTILLAIGFFTGAVTLLPRSGMWMKWVKLLSGLILLAFSYYLIYQSGATGGPS